MKSPGSGNDSGGTGSPQQPGSGGSTSGDSGGQQPGGGESGTSSEASAGSSRPAGNETGQRPNLPYQPEKEDAIADDASGLQIPKLLLNPAAAGIASGDGIMRMDSGRRAAPIVVAGTVCIAVVCAVISARAAIARLCVRIIGRIRSMLCGIFK